MAFFVNIGYFT